MISVIMSTYNEELEWIRIAIDSILNQTYSDFEFIIISDNPNYKEMNDLLKDYSIKDNRIKLYFNEKNLGLPLTLNKAISYCSGNYIARMDADDYSYPDRFEKQLDYLLKYNLDLVGGFYKEMGTNKNLGVQISGEKVIMDFLTVADVVAHPTWLCKRSFYTDLNGYRNILACEDYDLLLRAVKRGKHIDIANYVVCDYRRRKSSISNTNQLRQSVTAYYLLKHFKSIDEIDEKEISKNVDAICERESKKYRMSFDADLLEEYKMHKKYMRYVLYWLRYMLSGRINYASAKSMIIIKLKRLRIQKQYTS